jgi:hypothetical protein
MTSFDKQASLYKESFQFTIIILIALLVGVFILASFATAVWSQTKIMPSDLMGGIILLLIFLGVYLNFRKLEITVTEAYVEARYGLIAKRVDIKDIISVKPHTYKFWDYGGWGIRGFGSHIAFNITGDDYQGVLIKYKNKKRTAIFFFSSQNPDEVCQIIKSLRDDLV